MSAIAPILIGIATEIGAPIVKGILQKHVGGAAGEIGGVVIDAVAGKVGVPAEDLPTVPREQLETAIREVETETPELISAWTESQREANKLMQAEMAKDGAFGWMWRPAGMWLMFVCTAWYVILRPVLNAVLWSLGTGVQVEMGLDVGTFLSIFMTYMGLYMGGNTLIRSVAKNRGA